MPDAPALITIGSFEFPTPSTYVGLTATIVDSARNAAGYVIGSVIRNDVAKVEVSWRYLTVEQWSDILKLFTPSQGGAFYRDVTFFDQARAAWITRTMYVSDRTTGGLHMLHPETKQVQGWTNCQLSLVEV